jgi:hypothetical protein
VGPKQSKANKVICVIFARVEINRTFNSQNALSHALRRPCTQLEFISKSAGACVADLPHRPAKDAAILGELTRMVTPPQNAVNA